MRRTGKEKLHSQRGASLLFAFLFLLVASMVSTVVIAGAVTAVKRVHDDQQREQSYLTLESASRLLRYMLENTQVSIVEVTSGGELRSRDYESSGPLGGVIQGAVKTLYETPDSSVTVKRHFEVSVPDDPSVPESQSFQDVRMDFIMKKETDHSTTNYTIDGTIQVNDGISSSDYEQRLFLSDSMIPQSHSSTSDEDKITTTIKWEKIKLYTRKDRED